MSARDWNDRGLGPRVREDDDVWMSAPLSPPEPLHPAVDIARRNLVGEGGGIGVLVELFGKDDEILEMPQSRIANDPPRLLAALRRLDRRQQLAAHPRDRNVGSDQMLGPVVVDRALGLGRDDVV